MKKAMLKKIGSNLSERKWKKIKVGYKNKIFINYGRTNNLEINQETCKKNIYELGLQWLSRRHVIIFISILGKIQSPPIKVQKVFTYATQQLRKKKSNKREKPKW
jgi:hypothetical protein